MNVELAAEPSGAHVVRHCPAEEYRAFIASISESESTRRAWRRYRREFVGHYPDLRSWFEAPLVERIGRLQDESVHTLTCRRCYYARRYLYFLVLRGYGHRCFHFSASPARSRWRRTTASWIDVPSSSSSSRIRRLIQNTRGAGDG